jgi:hypothetical protein
MGSAGFSNEERAKFSELLAAGFVDSYRFLYPDKKTPIPGGHTASVRAKETLAGASTTF